MNRNIGAVPGVANNVQAFPAETNSGIILVQEEPRNASQQVEVPVTANGLTRVQFPDVQQLRNQGNQVIVIKGIRLINATVLTNAPLSGNTIAPLAELQKISMTLYSEGWERGQLIPVLVLNDIFTQGGNIPYRQFPTKFSSWRNVDWSKSYLQWSNGTVSAGATYSVLFDVEYVRYNIVNGQLVLATGQ